MSNGKLARRNGNSTDSWLEIWEKKNGKKMNVV